MKGDPSALALALALAPAVAPALVSALASAPRRVEKDFSEYQETNSPSVSSSLSETLLTPLSQSQVVPFDPVSLIPRLERNNTRSSSLEISRTQPALGKEKDQHECKRQPDREV